MKEEKILLEGIYAMIEEMRGKPCHTEVSATMPTVDLSGIETLIRLCKTQSAEQAARMEKSLAAKFDSIAANTKTEKTVFPEEKIDRIIEILQQPPQKPQPQKHHHVIDLKSSKVVKYLLMQWGIILFFTGFNALLICTNMELRDNDLKYRYIKSVNPNNDFIHRLEKTFKYERDREEIRNIRKKVKKYEDDVKKRAERIGIGE